MKILILNGSPRRNGNSTSTNGQIYTAATAPVILTTGAAGYGSQNNSSASIGYATDGYIAVSHYSVCFR